jgi:hypothetical protein
MGEDPDQLREAIEETRRRMDDTVVALGHKVDVRSQARAKVAEVRERVATLEWRRWIPYAAGAAVATGGAVTALIVVKARSGGPPQRLAGPARRLPEPARDRVLPVARRADRLIARTAGELGARRERMVRTAAREIARELAEQQERRNPIWARAGRDAATAAATTAATLLVRRALSTPVPPPVRKAEPVRGEPAHAVPMEQLLHG